MVLLGFEPEDIPSPVSIATLAPVQLSCEIKLSLHHPLLFEIFKKEKAYAF